jgi:hypothetical protein
MAIASELRMKVTGWKPANSRFLITEQGLGGNSIDLEERLSRFPQVSAASAPNHHARLAKRFAESLPSA